MHIVELMHYHPKGVWYLATPYSHWPLGHDAAAREAAMVTTRLQNDGLVVYSPIVHSHQLCVVDRTLAHPTLDHLSHEYWLGIDRVHIASACGLIVVRMPGWGESFGVRQEIGWFRDDFPAKPRFLLSPHDMYFSHLE